MFGCFAVGGLSIRAVYLGFVAFIIGVAACCQSHAANERSSARPGARIVLANAETFSARRQKLMDRVKPGSAILVTANPRMPQAADIELPFSQDSTFYYLTGLNEPHAAALLRPGHRKPYVLFVQPRDAACERWDGPRVGVRDATSVFGADEAYSIEKIKSTLPRLLRSREKSYFNKRKIAGLTVELDQTIERIAIAAAGRISNLMPHIVALRSIKEPGEIALIKRAIRITEAGIRRVIKMARPGRTELELVAELNRVYLKAGSREHAFHPIIAAGENGCICHYDVLSATNARPNNEGKLLAGDLVMIDSGAKWQHYASDITRTFPVSGKFTSAQSDIYDLVWQAEKEAIRAIKPGATFADIDAVVRRCFRQGLRDLGVGIPLIGNLLFHAAHPLGLDAHDVENAAQPFKPGMVLAIEPQLIFWRSDNPRTKPYQGMAVRIEDNVLITADGNELLSSLPKKRSEIEAMMR